MYVYVHIDMFINIHTRIHFSSHTYIHTYIHTYDGWPASQSSTAWLGFKRVTRSYWFPRSPSFDGSISNNPLSSR